MRIVPLLALACAASFSVAAAAADNPFEAFRGKIKAGMYEYKIDMDMGQIPGLPPGMGHQTHTFQHCVTEEDINRGRMSRDDAKGAPKDCQIENFRMSGNSADYTMVCSGRVQMRADNHITFTGDGYKMDMKMAMNQGGRPMNVKQHMEGRYVGACSK